MEEEEAAQIQALNWLFKRYSKTHSFQQPKRTTKQLPCLVCGLINVKDCDGIIYTRELNS
jgi:hypothetical protein